jgi:hypothetical protein
MPLYARNESSRRIVWTGNHFAEEHTSLRMPRKGRLGLRNPILGNFAIVVRKKENLTPGLSYRKILPFRQPDARHLHAPEPWVFQVCAQLSWGVPVFILIGYEQLKGIVGAGQDAAYRYRQALRPAPGGYYYADARLAEFHLRARASS